MTEVDAVDEVYQFYLAQVGCPRKVSIQGRVNVVNVVCVEDPALQKFMKEWLQNELQDPVFCPLWQLNMDI